MRILRLEVAERRALELVHVRGSGGLFVVQLAEHLRLLRGPHRAESSGVLEGFLERARLRRRRLHAVVLVVVDLRLLDDPDLVHGEASVELVAPVEVAELERGHVVLLHRLLVASRGTRHVRPGGDPPFLPACVSPDAVDGSDRRGVRVPVRVDLNA